MSGKVGYNYFIDAESNFAKVPLTTAAVGQPVFPQLVELFADEAKPIPFHVRSGQQSLGDPSERKRFKYVEFHGYGTNPGSMRVKIYVDGRYVCDGQATLSETPDKRRKVNLPIGQQLGYAIDVEFTGIGWPRAIEFTFEPMSGPS